MSKMISVRNTKNRYFNWARLNGVLQISSDRVNYYIKNWFKVIDWKIETKKNIVNDDKLKEELQKELEHLWIDFNKNLWVKKLQKLIYEEFLESILLAQSLYNPLLVFLAIPGFLNQFEESQFSWWLARL